MGIFDTLKKQLESQNRKSEEEQIRKNVEEAQKTYVAEFENKQKGTDESVVEKRMEVYNNFSSHTSVNCREFAEADFKCDFDEMEYTAQICPAQRYIDSCYMKDNGTYRLNDKGVKIVDDYSTTVALDLKMMSVNNNCVLYPRINVKCWFNTRFGGSTISELYIKVGENRYVATLPNVTIYTDRTEFGSHETDFATLVFGQSDIDILREIATGKYQSKIRLGKREGHIDLTDKDVRDIRIYLDVCDKAGVFDQPLFKEEGSHFKVITKYNIE